MEVTPKPILKQGHQNKAHTKRNKNNIHELIVSQIHIASDGSWIAHFFEE